MPTGRVVLVGAGPGDPGLLTLKGKRALESADALVYDYLAAAPIVALAPADCERIYVGKRAGHHTLEQDEISALLVELARKGKRVVRLKGGDPFVFGRGGEEAQALHDAGIPFEIVPGITSGIAAPAYAGIPVTHRDHNVAVTFITGHEDPNKAFSSLDFEKLADPHQTLVLYMAMGNLQSIAEALIAHGRAGSTPVAAIREGTKPSQATLVATLETIASEVERAQLRPPAIVVIGEVVALRERLAWFERSPLFGKRILITRPEADAIAFAERLWELGAEPVLAPLVRIAPPEDALAVRRAVEAAASFAWIVFSSRNGVDAFFAELHALGRDARALGTTRVAAIGPKTAQRLAQRGIHADFVPARYDSEAVADGLLQRSAAGDAIMLFRAREARDVVPESLRAAGRTVDVVAAYRALPAEVEGLAELARGCDVLTFTSAGTVRSFASQVQDAPRLARGKLVACIGPVTADAARACGLEVGVVADEFTIEGLLEALLAVPLRA
ncbi:MAG: uroporphyrinogen-III C-methyltransferase [Candidatus Eremiobacteraeota bacterium]|nr:uroporphyrinogen-III C-methyltransferase [Candidatus Eremiobacteraeota bacterium]